MKRTRKRRGRPKPARRASGPAESAAHLPDLERRSGTGPALTGGDVDADWQRAASSGEEAVGGSVATPDQDVVDEIGRAVGVEQGPDAPVRTSEEILRERDERYWEIERKAADEDARREDGRAHLGG